MKSKNIADYFEARLKKLRPEEVIPFSVYLYFPMNAHIIVFKKSGELVTQIFLDKYLERGIIFIWIHAEERELFEDYLQNLAPKSEAIMNLPLEPAVPEHVSAQHVSTEQPISNEMQTFAGRKMDEIMKKNIAEPKKAALLANEARKVLSRTVGQAATLGEQKESIKSARAVVEDLLRDQMKNPENLLLNELWKLAKSAPEFEHGANVATYATLLAFAFGRIQSDLIADLAFAGLLHDIGLSQNNYTLNTRAWQQMSREDLKTYSAHVEITLSMLADYAPALSPRVSQMILQHHEKFDGSGYPNKIEGFRIDDISQLLAVADLIDSMCSGRWDGEERTLSDAFNTLERLEKSSTFPEYFNPEIFAAVLKWIRSTESNGSMEVALDRVKKQRGEIVPN